MKMSDPKEVTPEPVPLAAEDDLTGVDLEVDELLGGAVGNEPSDDLNKELDLDELNDNLRDYLEDNLSLEVNFGDGSSCRASDDKLESGAGEERNSSRSVSSERDRASGIDSQDLSDGASETTPTAPESLHTSISEGSQSSESNTGSVQQRNSLEIRNNIPDINETKDYAKDSGEDRNKLQPVGAVPKIRKKSPGLARRLADSMQFEGSDRDTSSSERESEPAQIDTTVHSAQKDFETQLNTQLRCGSAPFASHPVVPPTETTQVPNGLGSKEKSSSFEKLCDSLLGNDPNGLRIPQDSDTSPDDSDKMDPSLKSMEVENEYDYIKYARIQHGDWYVGMRLAYSSSNDSLSAKRSISGGLRASDDEYLGSSREGSPEKTSQRQSKLSDHLSLSKVNEDTLTEIPLNGSDHAGNDEKNFSLSPEATECDSAEVESVLSDEGKSSTSGFPAVEDGLSSSQGSDTEDPIGPEMQTTPAELLKRRYKAEIEQELKSTDLVAFSGDDHQSMSLTDNSSLRSTPSHHSGGSGHDSSHGSEHHSSHSSHSHRHPPEVDAAIQDIKSAIKRSKHAALQHEESLRSGGQQEPIWVMRDSYVRKLGPGNNDIQRVHEEYESHGDDTIDLPQDGGYPVDEETDQYRDFENTDGKTFPSSKGFDSDDEVDDNRGIFNQTRRVKGKQYKALPEAEDDPPYSQHGNHRNLNARKQPSTLVSGPSAHSGTAPNRTMGSVRASANNGISGTTDMDSSNRNKNDGVQNPHSFSSAIPHSRYRTVNPPQSQPRLSSSKSPTTAPLVDIGSSNSTSASGTSQQVHSHTDTGYTNPSRTSHSQPSSVTSDLRSQYSESDEEPRNRPRARRRYPSYEYHDDTDDEYYSDSDREPSTYVRRRHMGDGEYDTDEETDELLDKQYMRPDAVDIPELTHPPVNKSAEVGEEQVEKRRSRAREVTLRDPDNETVLIEGVLFRARYLGSTQLISEGQPSKGLRMMQAQEAVGRIKAPEGENQPSTEVDLFVSIEKIMVLNTDLQEIMMDHALRTISYIADIGDLLVIMARRGPVLSNDAENRKRQTKICCHVFESDEAQLIAQSIGQAFQVAYMEFLKANGIEDTSMFKEIDYQEVLNQQEIFGEELFLFSNKEMQKEVIVPKLKNEPLGVVIVESGWGSMVPTVVLANMSPTGAAARGGQLNIGDQIMSINGVSLVGLPLSSCQTYIKAAKHQTVVKLNVVSCAPVVEVCIKRPDVKYQLGFSVQNGVICSLLRGGIAERGGVRVGHRIIEINGESVVAVPHEKIVKMLATSVGEIHMKTMPTSIFRLLTGQDVPHYI